MYYLRARCYDAAAGRFTQEDTYLGDGRNLYAYTHNNPVRYVDPSGHAAFDYVDFDDEELDDWQEPNGGGYANVQQTGNSTGGSTGYVPNPYGRLGGPAHKSVVQSIQATRTGGEIYTEVRFDTSNIYGGTSCRYADAVEVANGKVVNIYQVGKVNQNGMPVSRESRAIADIMSASDYNGAPVHFIPYNSPIQPIIFY